MYVCNNICTSYVFNYKCMDATIYSMHVDVCMWAQSSSECVYSHTAWYYCTGRAWSTKSVAVVTRLRFFSRHELYFFPRALVRCAAFLTSLVSSPSFREEL